MVKFYNLEARHIVVACRVASTETTLGFDFEDDDEHGAGQALLTYMESAEIENRALYVVRNYDGEHIGPARFDCIIDAAKSAINQRPFNSIMQKFQFSWPRNRRGRGGRGGYNNSRLRTASEASETPSVADSTVGEDEQEVMFNPQRATIDDWANQPTETSSVKDSIASASQISMAGQKND